MDPRMTTSAELQATTEAALRGDVDARDHLVQSWLPVVVRWCARLGGPRVDPEDAAHDVFIVALQKMDKVRDARAFGAWIFGITRRTLARHRRRAWVRRWIPGLTVDAPDPADGPARLAAVSETGRQVQEVLETLPELEREVLVLAVLEDRTDQEVATMLGVPLGTIKSRLHRARARFHQRASVAGLVGQVEET